MENGGCLRKEGGRFFAWFAPYGPTVACGDRSPIEGAITGK